MKRRNILIKSLLLLISIIPIFFIPMYIGMQWKYYYLFGVLSVLVSIVSLKYYFPLFPAVLFFSITHLLWPINNWFVELVNFNFPGTFFLIPILVFILLVLVFKSIRKEISWLRRDKIDQTSIFLMLGLIIISGIALIIWGVWIADDLTRFTKNLPELPIIWILINGISFAIFNALVEEFLARGMLCNGLEKIFKNTILIIIIQAVIFGLWHINGFPGGILGIVMVFIWSIVLGIIRYRTKGLLAVIVSHLFADFTIYIILYILK